MNVIAYTRVSTSEQGKSGLGLEAQFAYIENFCKFHNLTIVAHYQDVVSGKLDSEEDRPNMAKAFHHAKKIGAAVIVSKLDRLSRRAAFIMNLMEKQVKFISAERGLDVDPFMLHIDAIMAEKERKTIGERTRMALGAKKARGELLGCHTHKNPEAAREKALEASRAACKAASDVFAERLRPMMSRMRASRMTVQQIAEELNQLGTTTMRGGRWHGSTVDKIIKRLNIA